MNIQKFNNDYEFSSNTYVVSNDSNVIVIDPGYYNGDFKCYLEELGKVDAILLTHGHFDHIGGIDLIKDDFPTVKIYIHEGDYEFAFNPMLNYSRQSGFDLIITSNLEKMNQKLNVGDFKIDIIHTPGHTRGSVLLYFQKEKLLFTGDTIIGYSIGGFRFPTSDVKELKESIKKFIKLNCADDVIVCSGHDNIMTYKDIMINNQYVKKIAKNNKL